MDCFPGRTNALKGVRKSHWSIWCLSVLVLNWTLSLLEMPQKPSTEKAQCVFHHCAGHRGQFWKEKTSTSKAVTVVTSIFQRKKLRLRKLRWLAQSHTVSKGQSRSLKPENLAPKSLFLRLLFLTSPLHLQPFESFTVGLSLFPVVFALILACINYLLPCKQLPKVSTPNHMHILTHRLCRSIIVA